jgi:hypothetical protein
MKGPHWSPVKTPADRYEERAIGDAIDNQVQDTGWTTAVFEFRSS